MPNMTAYAIAMQSPSMGYRMGFQHGWDGREPLKSLGSLFVDQEYKRGLERGREAKSGDIWISEHA